MRQQQKLTHGVTTAAHAVTSGDASGGGAAIDLSEGS
jgi:type IV secretion system protein TrbL